MSKSDCSCLLCKPVPGRRSHPKYGYDLDMVREQECLSCHHKIGDEPYVEQLAWARFGSMSFVHQRCETPSMVKTRSRVERNWDARCARESEGEE